MAEQPIHLGSTPDPAVLESIADFICGDDEKYPVYRSSMYLSKFFNDLEINATHDGTTRKWWVLHVLEQLQPDEIEKIILRLVDIKEYKGDREKLKLAVRSMNDILLMENMKVGFTSGSTPALFRNTSADFNQDDILNEDKVDENEFLKKQFDSDIDINELNLDPTISSILQDRVNEIQSCPRNKVSLGSIFLMGSTLEGLLLTVASQKQTEFQNAPSAPQDRNGNTKKIIEWKLSELIEVAYETNYIQLDVKKFSHVLRDFRNYIHPYQQMSQKFTPDQHTVDICWQVFKAAFNSLKNNL